jgi:hypothetical protein
MWSPANAGTALLESPANQVTVRVVESGSRDASGAQLARPRFENERIVIEILGDVFPPEHVTQKRPRCVSIVGVNQRMN